MLRIPKSFNFIRFYATEMKYLNVAEKHDAAKTIAGLLSNGTARRREGYSVYNKVFDFEAPVKGRNCKMVMTSVSGHLLNLEFLVSYRNWNRVDPQSLFDAPIRKACSEQFQPIKKTLEREIKSCQGLIIWTDCDREGENIGFEIIEVCRGVKQNLTVYRAMFSEITKQSVRRALENLKTPDKLQSDAVDVRTELDLRTGAAITRLQTMRLQRLFPEKIADKLISYGSCQIPTLGFVAERYKEVEAFVSEPFWKLRVSHTIDDLTVEFNWARNRLFDKDACEDYLLLCLANPSAKVESVSVKPKHKWRPTPLDTVEMEKLGSRKLKLSAKETMTIAEKLYGKGIISYPRTDTNMFSKEIDLRSLVELQCAHSEWGSFAQRVIEAGPNPRNGNKSDQAHPPIHPTKLVTDLNGNEARVYELICRHFLACVSKDAVGSETIVHINIAGEKFNATGLYIYERNYLDVYIYDKWNAKQIHKYEEGQVFEPTEIDMHEGATTAPPLLTEADLIALMEKHGIGTDATHAEHINTIKERGYIGVVDKGCLVPGVIGMGLYEGYDAMEVVLAKPLLRAQFEADLKKICLGEKDPKVVLAEQISLYKEAYKKITEHITAMDEKISLRINETPAVNSNANENNSPDKENCIQELFQCPKCSVASLALKQKKNKTGFFIGCLNFPDCKNAVWLPDECKEPTVLKDICENCGNGIKLLKFKFSTPFYKSMFNTPSGWYKTCLHCDSRLREAFNINLDSVKRVGTIVSASVEPVENSRPPNNRQTKNPKKKLETKGTKTITRKYSTQSSSSRTIQNIESSISRSDNHGIDDFFENDDGFDDLMVDAERAVANLSGDRPQSFSNEISDSDLAAIFLEDDFSAFDTPKSSLNTIEERSEKYTWGTSGRTNVNSMNTTIVENRPNCLICNEPAKEFVVKKPGPNCGKKFYVCPKPSPCKFFQWADGNPTSPHTTNQSQLSTSSPKINSQLNTRDESITCKCGKQANSFTVRKEGPNLGRSFFSCPNRDKSCGFFKWGDEDNNASTSTGVQSSNIVWGTGKTTSTSNLTKKSESTKRKCGICRQEGHTRQKCPRTQ